MNELLEHILAMADDPYLCGHPEWEEIVKESEALRQAKDESHDPK